MNKVILMGNLGSDAELKFTNGQQAVCNFRVATTEKWKDKNGEKQERTEWHSCQMWGKRAEAISKFLTKGSKVLVEGKLQTRSWEDKDGNKRYRTEINVSEIEFAGGKGGGGRRDDTAGGSMPSEQTSAGAGFGDTYGDDFGGDDVPF